VGIEGHAVMEGIVVRDTTRGLAPLALQLQESKFAPAPSTLALSYSRFSNNARVALHFFGSDADVRATEIRDMPEYGAIVEPCIQVRTGVQNGTAGTFVGAGMSFENCRDAALLASAVDAELRDSVIIGGDLGRGVIVQRDPTIAGFSGALRLEGVSIEDSREFAVSAHATPLTMVGVRIARTAPESSGLFGDGVAVIALAGQPSPEAWISQTRVDDSTRAGLSSFGATVTLKNNAFVCQALELGVEPHVGYDAALIDDGGNFCGCPEATGACNASTTALTPPAPLDPIEP
jgi:hypothetical protein